MTWLWTFDKFGSDTTLDILTTSAYPGQ